MVPPNQKLAALRTKNTTSCLSPCFPLFFRFFSLCFSVVLSIFLFPCFLLFIMFLCCPCPSPLSCPFHKCSLKFACRVPWTVQIILIHFVCFFSVVVVSFLCTYSNLFTVRFPFLVLNMFLFFVILLFIVFSFLAFSSVLTPFSIYGFSPFSNLVFCVLDCIGLFL